MGKFNFDYSRIQSLEKRVQQLEVQNQVLMNENNQMKAYIGTKSPHSVNERALARMVDENAYNELFNFDVNPKTGAITIASKGRMNTNFTNLYRSLLTVIKPVGKCTNGGKNKFYIKNPNLYELNNEEFEIFKVTVNEVMQKLLKAKRKMKLISTVDSEDK